MTTVSNNHATPLLAPPQLVGPMPERNATRVQQPRNQKVEESGRIEQGPEQVNQVAGDDKSRQSSSRQRFLLELRIQNQVQSVEPVRPSSSGILAAMIDHMSGAETAGSGRHVSTQV